MKKHSKTLITGATFMLLTNLIKTFVLFLNKILIGRTLGPEILGTFTIANTLFQILSFISIFGLYKTINRFAPKYIIENNNNRLGKLFSTGLSFTIIVSLFLVTLIFLYSSNLNNLFNNETLDSTIKILIIGLPFLSLLKILFSISTSFETTKIQGFIENIIVPILITVLLLVFVRYRSSAEVISLSYTISYFLAFLTTLILMKIFLKNKARLLFFPNIDSNFLIYSIPIFLNDILFFILNWFDTLAIGKYASTKEVGIYNASYSLAILPRLFLISANTIFLPVFSRLNSQGNLKSGFALYKNILRLLTFITLPLVIVIVLFNNELLDLFGKGFASNVNLILILSIGVVGNIFSGPIDNTMNALDKNKLVTINSAIALFINIILNILLIPKIGVSGAAIANTVSILFQNYIGVFELYILEKFFPYNKKSVLSLLLGLLLFLFLSLIKRKIDSQAELPITLLFASLFGIMTYFLYSMLLVVFKLYSKDDLKLLNLLKSFYEKG